MTAALHSKAESAVWSFLYREQSDGGQIYCTYQQRVIALGHATIKFQPDTSTVLHILLPQLYAARKSVSTAPQQMCMFPF